MSLKWRNVKECLSVIPKMTKLHFNLSDSRKTPFKFFSKLETKFKKVKTRELFIHGKAMVPYVQMSTNCGLHIFITVVFTILTAYLFYSWLTTANMVQLPSRV